MFILHLTLQGCYKNRPIPYGITSDTGGHLTYVDELCRAQAKQPNISQVLIVTRLFDDPKIGSIYAQPHEQLAPKLKLIRLSTQNLHYLTKEELHTQNLAFSEELIKLINSLDRKPDLIHAHYADAGWIAAQVKSELGIPYLFTPHSLGTSKLSPSSMASDTLKRRISIEQYAIDSASAVLVSSEHEATEQLDLYQIGDKSRVHVIPPGCELTRFSAQGSDTSDSARLVDKFLTKPDKPVLFALARPVTKKNLTGLVELYAKSTVLKEQANLLIMAGIRDDLKQLTPESRKIIEELLYLIDKYDLYGKVALPKTHQADQVPSFYELVRKRQGVFINLALCEPFGLTLIEAAAAGLPLVATSNGGSKNTIEQLGSGYALDPSDTNSITAHLIELTSNHDLWTQLSYTGQIQVQQYSWSSFLTSYFELVNSILKMTQKPDTLLICDIDNTITGCQQSADRLNQLLCFRDDVIFAVATGRDIQNAQRILSEHQINHPSIWITSVGSEIYYLIDGGLVRDTLWDQHIDYLWQPQSIRAHIHSMNLDGVELQSDADQRLHKVSYFGSTESANQIRTSLNQANISAYVVHSHDRLLDILPIRAGKGLAIEFVKHQQKYRGARLIVAGDSGNDIDMLTSSARSIVVANHEPILKDLKHHKHIYFSKARYASGILEGLKHFEQVQ